MTTSEADIKILIPCTEPACDHYDAGHEEYQVMARLGGEINHVAHCESGQGLWVSVEKYGDDPWRVEYQTDAAGPFCNPEEAKVVAQLIWDAAAVCRDLNARVHS